jgi:hypothetical protein
MVNEQHSMLMWRIYKYIPLIYRIILQALIFSDTKMRLTRKGY